MSRSLRQLYIILGEAVQPSRRRLRRRPSRVATAADESLRHSLRRHSLRRRCDGATADRPVRRRPRRFVPRRHAGSDVTDRHGISRGIVVRRLASRSGPAFERYALAFRESTTFRPHLARCKKKKKNKRIKFAATFRPEKIPRDGVPSDSRVYRVTCKEFIARFLTRVISLGY